jgi:hypothetical protein
MTRRSFLMAFLSLLFFHKKAMSRSSPELTDEAILRGILDALIPSDDTPGAREVNLYEKLIDLISEDKKIKKLYEKGFLLVRKEIEKTQEKQIDWDAILRQITPSSFFRRFRYDAMRLFYSDPIGWKSAGYRGPPIVGYRDYHRCEQ